MCGGEEGLGDDCLHLKQLGLPVVSLLIRSLGTWDPKRGRERNESHLRHSLACYKTQTQVEYKGSKIYIGFLEL